LAAVAAAAAASLSLCTRSSRRRTSSVSVSMCCAAVAAAVRASDCVSTSSALSSSMTMFGWSASCVLRRAHARCTFVCSLSTRLCIRLMCVFSSPNAAACSSSSLHMWCSETSQRRERRSKDEIFVEGGRGGARTCGCCPALPRRPSAATSGCDSSTDSVPSSTRHRSAHAHWTPLYVGGCVLRMQRYEGVVTQLVVQLARNRCTGGP